MRAIYINENKISECLQEQQRIMRQAFVGPIEGPLKYANMRITGFNPESNCCTNANDKVCLSVLVYFANLPIRYCFWVRIKALESNR